MTDLDRREEPEDPKVLRSAAVDVLKDAARQSDPREFNRLTRHALALIERARAIAHGRQHAASEEREAQASQSDDKANPRSPYKITKFFVKLRRIYPRRTRH
jgi:Na+/phosphate symporter